MEVAESSSQLQPANMEDIEVQLDDNVTEAAKLAKHTLVGRILAARSLNRNAVKEILSKAWNVQEELNISDLGPNVFLFNFSDRKIAARVLEEGPWFVMGNLLSLQYWTPEATVFEINYDLVGFWIQLHGIPLELMTSKNATKLAANVGEVLTVENPYVNGILIRPFFRVRVLVNIKKPLITGFCVPRKDLPRTRIMVRYERLQGFCYSCGVIGHDNRKCNKEPIMTTFDPTRPKYSSHLGVPPARSLTTIVTENHNRVKKLKDHEDDDMATKDKDGDHHHPQPQKHTDSHPEGEHTSVQETGGQPQPQNLTASKAATSVEIVVPTNLPNP
ncbi:Zinc finger, CCHC-type [Sesbania bispinosa]|nr:Zinc finger, CCHC-type [Sesbania bispinosa]